MVQRIIKESGFRICETRVEEEIPERRIAFDDLNLCEKSKDYLRGRQIDELWTHQHAAVKKVKEGRNVCVTTSTSSGKSEIFFLAALEKLHENQNSKVLVVYPMKALNAQQRERWERTGLNVGQIDGDVKDMRRRAEILRNRQVVAMTPDTIHAYLLRLDSNDPTTEVKKDFIRNVSLVIIDELHLYKGLFGTNSAYLFRRLNNVRRSLCNENRNTLQYITASATMPNATDHSSNITGADNFIEIGIDQDGSPSQRKTYLFIESNDNNAPIYSSVSKLTYALAEEEDSKIITFVQGRQKTSQIADVAPQVAKNRLNKDIENEEELASFEHEISDKEEHTQIYPFRAGYEKQANDTLCNKLNTGQFKGIISTSALEIGIDIEGLNIVIIADMPYDMNSYQQRIGRCGRYGTEVDSYVIIVKDPRSFASKLLFEDFNYEIDQVLPDYEPALYLDDPYILATQAWLHVGDHDECEFELNSDGKRHVFDDGKCFPSAFVDLCNAIISNQVNVPYKDYINNFRISGGSPHINFPLRSFGKQFKIYYEDGTDTNEIIDRTKLVNEAYPKAIRRTREGEDANVVIQRIIKVDEPLERIIVRKDNNQYAKTISNKRTYLRPNFNKAAINKTLTCGTATVLNLEVIEKVVIYGYSEFIGRSRKNNTYTSPFSLRGFLTTSTMFFHPSFQNKGVKTGDIAKILFETFLRRNAFDRNDINYLGGRLTYGNEEFEPLTKFVALYDVTKFNITQRVIDEDRIIDMFTYLRNHLSTISFSICGDLNKETFNSLKELCDSVLNNELIVVEKDWGNTKQLKDYTEIVVLEFDEDSNEYIELTGRYLGKSNQENKINVLVNGNLTTVDYDEIKVNDNTEFI